MTDYEAQPGRAAPARAIPTDAEHDAADARVQHGLTGLAAMVSGLEDVDEILARIATLAVSALTGVAGAGVTLAQYAADPVRVRAWAVTDAFVRDIDELQYEVVDEGPCLDAMRTRRPVVSGSLGSDPRWRRFGARVARLGVHSCLSLPLLVDGDVIGAINAYSRERDAFGADEVELGMRFAVPAAVTLYNNAHVLVASRERAEQLQRALTSRAVIDQAIGILRSRTGLSADEAFDRLRQLSQAEGVRLALVAERIVAEAVGRARARRT